MNTLVPPPTRQGFEAPYFEVSVARDRFSDGEGSPLSLSISQASSEQSLSISSRSAHSERKGRKVACLACRGNKLKCDGNHPCANCKKRGKDCEFRAHKRPGPKTKSGDVSFARSTSPNTLQLPVRQSRTRRLSPVRSLSTPDVMSAQIDSRLRSASASASGTEVSTLFPQVSELLMGDNRATSPPPEPSNAWAAQSESSSFYSPSTAYSGSDYFYECESHVSSSSIAAPIEDTANATAVPTITPIIISSSSINAPSFPLTGSDFASFRGIFNETYLKFASLMGIVASVIPFHEEPSDSVEQFVHHTACYIGANFFGRSAMAKSHHEAARGLVGEIIDNNHEALPAAIFVLGTHHLFEGDVPRFKHMARVSFSQSQLAESDSTLSRSLQTICSLLPEGIPTHLSHQLHYFSILRIFSLFVGPLCSLWPQQLEGKTAPALLNKMPPSAESFLKAAIASNGKAISLLTSHQHLRPIQQKDAEAIADLLSKWEEPVSSNYLDQFYSARLNLMLALLHFRCEQNEVARHHSALLCQVLSTAGNALLAFGRAEASLLHNLVTFLASFSEVAHLNTILKFVQNISSGNLKVEAASIQSDIQVCLPWINTPISPFDKNSLLPLNDLLDTLSLPIPPAPNTQSPPLITTPGWLEEYDTPPLLPSSQEMNYPPPLMFASDDSDLSQLPSFY